MARVFKTLYKLRGLDGVAIHLSSVPPGGDEPPHGPEHRLVPDSLSPGQDHSPGPLTSQPDLCYPTLPLLERHSNTFPACAGGSWQQGSCGLVFPACYIQGRVHPEGEASCKGIEPKQMYTQSKWKG